MPSAAAAGHTAGPWISHAVQRATGVAARFSPTVAGIGAAPLGLSVTARRFSASPAAEEPEIDP